MASFFGNVRTLPPCVVCGSKEVKENNLKVDWVKGSWQGGVDLREWPQERL